MIGHMNYNEIVVTTIMILCFGVMYWITCERILKLGTTDFNGIRDTLSKNLFYILICSTLVVSACNTMLHGILYGDADKEAIDAAAAIKAEKVAIAAEKTAKTTVTAATKDAAVAARQIADEATLKVDNADKADRAATKSTIMWSVAYCISFLLSTFLLIGLFPSLNDIFENSLGLFIVSSSSFWNYANIIKAFENKKNKDIPTDYVISMFNIRNVSIKLKDIYDSNEYYDFKVDESNFCTEAGDSMDIKRNFERDLFSLCLAKYCIGHFAWLSISSVVAMLLTRQTMSH